MRHHCQPRQLLLPHGLAAPLALSLPVHALSPLAACLHAPVLAVQSQWGPSRLFLPFFPSRPTEAQHAHRLLPLASPLPNRNGSPFYWQDLIEDVPATPHDNSRRPKLKDVGAWLKRERGWGVKCFGVGSWV